MAIAILITGSPDEYFHEGGFVTFLSFAQLLFISTIAWDVYRVRNKGNQFDLNNPQIAWLFISLGFVFLALDEVLNLRQYICNIICDLSSGTDFATNFSDFSIIFYALIGITIMYLFREEIKLYETATPLLITGFLLLIVMVMFNLMNRMAFISDIIPDPESAEIVMRYLTVFVGVTKIFTESVFIGVLSSCNETAHELEAA